jgi:GGDEF domain-containing protein
VHATDLRDDPAVRGLLVEWLVQPDPGDAGRDPLTGLSTHARLAADVAAAAARGDTALAVVRLRPDRPLPDEAMRQVGHRLAHALRSGDLAGRLPDGDVVVVCPGAWTGASASHVAQRLRSHVNGPVRGDAGVVTVRLSAGVATGPADTFDALVQRAYHDLMRSGWRMRPTGAEPGVDAE